MQECGVHSFKWGGIKNYDTHAFSVGCSLKQAGVDAHLKLQESKSIQEVLTHYVKHLLVRNTNV